MDEQIAKYLTMLEDDDPQQRIVGLDCLFTDDPRSELVETTLKTMAVSDDSFEVRKKAIGLFTKKYETTSNQAACQFLANIVDNTLEQDPCRRKAYFGMKMICFTLPQRIANSTESVSVQLESVFSMFKRVAEIQTIDKGNFDVDRDVDWQFVNQYLA